MTVTVAYVGKKAEVERALSGDFVRVWDGKAEVTMRPVGPVQLRKSQLFRGAWRGDREVEPWTTK